MERRKRVQQILESKDFCRELEKLVHQENLSGESDPERLKTLQKLTELTLSRGEMAVVNLHNSLGHAGSIVPIADLYGNEPYSSGERIARNKLASLYRLVDLFNWSQGIYNHITLRLPGDDPPEILINPFGLLYHEITASSLVKISLDGKILDSGTTKLGINNAGYVLHSAIHGARPDVQCVLHMHTSVVSAVSSMKCGLLPICQEAMIIGPIAYHDYQGIVSDEEERESIVNDLGDKNIRAAKAGIDNLVIPDGSAVEKAYQVARHGGGGVNKVVENGKDPTPKWRIGELEWEAWMRVLDCSGHKTGHIYRQPFLKARHQTRHSSINRINDVTQPPATSAYGMLDETDTEAMAAYRLALLRKEQEKARWLNSPNNYQKVHIYETGTNNPKIITKWVQDSSQSQNGTPVKINATKQFNSGGTGSNPKEFKEKQQELKENRRAGVINAGPQSVILDATHLNDNDSARDFNADGYKDIVIIGTASKGIIDRQHQHNAQVYRHIYSQNPFSRETDDEINKYIKEVEQKSRSASAMEKRDISPRHQYNIVESPTPDTASLMQAVRKGRPTKSASMDDEIDGETAGISPKAIGDYRMVTKFDENSDHYSTTFIENELPQHQQSQQNYKILNSSSSPPLQKPVATPQETPRHQKSTFPVIQRPTILAPLPPLEYPPKFRHSFKIMPELERNNLTSRSEMTSVHAAGELAAKDGKKKKRKGFFSFVRKKK
uniref:Class II aldolase/adducin N-terminal domain-containing protein n=1 Tax=Panagrolaimus sp. ES5 TaxID=591445 RepID=A0AC34F635_9BILA